MAKAVLSAPQFQSEAAAFAYVEARLWPNGPVCRHCGEAERIGKLQGKSTRPGLYKCYRCRKPFTVRMGTIFESSHLPLHLWLQVIHLMCASKKGIASRQIQRMLQCSMKTAWFLTHRIREAMNENPGCSIRRSEARASLLRQTKPTWAAKRKIAPTAFLSLSRLL
jgi:transposase-like protein